MQNVLSDVQTLIYGENISRMMTLVFGFSLNYDDYLHVHGMKDIFKIPDVKYIIYSGNREFQTNEIYFMVKNVLESYSGTAVRPDK